MKVWWVFAYDDYCYSGGMNNFRASFSTEEEAKEYAESSGHVRDVVEVINITEYLN